MSEKIRQFLVFGIEDKLYGLDIGYINTIIDCEVSLTRVPGASKCIEGVTNLRGDIIPVMSLAKRLGLKAKSDDEDTRIIITEKDYIVTGLKVDFVNEVFDFDENALEIVSDSENAGKLSQVLYGIGKSRGKAVALLNLERILEDG